MPEVTDDAHSRGRVIANCKPAYDEIFNAMGLEGKRLGEVGVLCLDS